MIYRTGNIKSDKKGRSITLKSHSPYPHVVIENSHAQLSFKGPPWRSNDLNPTLGHFCLEHHSQEEELTCHLTVKVSGNYVLRERWETATNTGACFLYGQLTNFVFSHLPRPPVEGKQLSMSWSHVRNGVVWVWGWDWKERHQGVCAEWISHAIHRRYLTWIDHSPSY